MEVTSLETWYQIDSPHVSGVSFILREMYSSIAICVRNRSPTPVDTVADCTQCTNASLMMSAEQVESMLASKQKEGDETPLPLVARETVPLGRTVVVGVLKPILPGVALIPKVRLHLLPLLTPTEAAAAGIQTRSATTAVTTEADNRGSRNDGLFKNAATSSNEVSAWLEHRRKTRDDAAS